MWLPIVQGGLQALGGFFSGRRQSREAEKDRELRRQQLGLERQRLGLERQRYGDAMARERARSQFAAPALERFTSSGAFGDVGKFDPSKYARKPQQGGSREDLEALLRGRQGAGGGQ